MEQYTLKLDPSAAAFYRKIAEATEKTTETVLADALFRLAGILSREVSGKKKKNVVF